MSSWKTTGSKKSNLLSVFLFIEKAEKAIVYYVKKIFSSFKFFLQIAFLVDSSIQFICTWCFYPFAEYPFSFWGISWWSSNSSFKASHPVGKRNKKIFYFILFCFILFYFIFFVLFYFILFYQFWGFKDKMFRWKSIPILSPPEYTSTKKSVSPDISPGPIFGILWY